MVSNPDFSIYNNFMSPVLVLDKDNKIVFKNILFIKNFGNIKNLERFSNNFSFDICVLDSENLMEATPINYAITSKENFTANTTYQKTKDQYFYYLITAFYDKEYKVLAFKNITTDILYEKSEKKYNFIRQQYLSLIDANKQFATLQQQSQAQTVKLAIMHRISNVIRESIDLNRIIDSTLRELFNLFGATKVYYAEYQENEFKIKDVFPEKYNKIAGTKIEFTPESLICIKNKNIEQISCIKDFINSEENNPIPITRIVIPIYRMHEILGLLIIYTHQKTFDDSQNDVLQSIATQLASAIVQASLFSQIKQKNETLENTLNELKETQLQLINSEKMASLGQLVAGVAHEINTPLGSINANNDLLAKIIKKLDESNTNDVIINNIKNLNNIDKEAIKRISSIVKSLKRFVRLDEAELQFADINKELDLTLELIKHETKNKIEIIKNYGPIQEIKCYPNMLNQVFMNILVNACQSIETKGTIEITTLAKDNKLIVKIKDNGCGIDDSLKEKLFTIGTTTKKIGIGTGLGLAISKKIIEKHTGQIYFDSQKGIGAEFTIELPYIQ